MRGMFQRGPVQVRANLTPLIDVTFLLIVFFVLVAQITNTQIVEEIDLPEPEHAVSIEPEEEPRLVLNIMPSADKRRVISYRLGTLDFAADPEGLRALTLELRSARESEAELALDLRADHQAPFGRIYPAMTAARAAGFRRINLVVLASTDRDQDVIDQGNSVGERGGRDAGNGGR